MKQIFLLLVKGKSLSHKVILPSLRGQGVQNQLNFFFSILVPAAMMRHISAGTFKVSEHSTAGFQTCICRIAILTHSNL